MTKPVGYVAGFKTVEQDPVVRFETRPGKQMQVDFTTIPQRARSKLSLPHSGLVALPMSAFPSMSVRRTDCAVSKRPVSISRPAQEILFDNAIIMIERDAYGEGHHRWNAQMLTVARDYGFVASGCRPYRARTKGKVERFNGYLKRSFITPSRPP